MPNVPVTSNKFSHRVGRRAPLADEMLLDLENEGGGPAADELLSWRFIEIVPEFDRAACAVVEFEL